MWVFRREVWQGISVTAPGMAFSQEIKNSAIRAGFRVREVPIEYRLRGGQVKLRALSDGLGNLRGLFAQRLSLRGRGQAALGQAEEAAPAALSGAMADYASHTAK
jgi:hypothetical protein